jgi:PAS domain S-box-containing protein
MNGVFGFPLQFSAQVIGVAVFTTQNKGGFMRSQLNVFNSLSQVLGAEIYRKKVEDELSQIFDTAQDIICILGFDGKFKKINRGACYLLGFSEEELLSGSFMDFVHPEDWIETETVLDHLCQGQNFIHFFNRLVTKEGKVIWLDWNSSVIIDEELVYSVAKDITEERELQSLLDSANKMARIGFWEVDVASGIQYWSPVAKEIHEVEDTYTVNVEQGIGFYVPEARPIIMEYFNRCLETGEPYDLELQIISAKGKRIWIRTQAQAEFVEGVCRRVYGSIQDISDLKNTQTRLRDALYEKNQILESIGDGFISLDKDWIVTYWNHSAERLLQKPKDQAIGRNIRQVLSKDIAANSVRNYKKAIDNNSPLVYEEFFSELGIWFEISVFPSSIGISVYFKDVSFRKTTEELIRQSNERFEKVAEATNEAIWDWEVPENKLYWGPGYKILFGLDPSDSGNSYGFWVTRVHEEDLASVEHRIKLALEDKEIFNFSLEYRFKKADGTYAFVTDKSAIIRDKSGKPTRMVGAVQDITDQKLHESSLKSLNEELEARAQELANSNAELEQFAYVASHDLQEPPRMVSSFLTQLESKYGSQLDERAKKYIYFAVDGAKRMRQIILDLLEFSRVGRILEEPGIIDLNQVIAEVCSLQSNRIKEKNAVVHFSDLPIIKGYRTPMIQVFQNLIGNAVKYSKESHAPEVNITCRELAESWEFSVQDNGIGMEADHFDKIFVIFQRLHTKDKFSGSGIGLAIVKKIIENLGGKIWLESELGTGTTFYFTLKK